MNFTERLLRRTATRLRLVRFGSWYRRAFLGGAILFLAALLSARLLGALPIHFALWSLALLPVAALAVALAALRRPKDAVVARVIDTRGQTKDLFLTAVLVGDASGDFRPVVCAAAEKQAETMEPAKLVPLLWTRGALEVVILLAILAVAIRWLPQLDPLHKVAARTKTSEQAQQLREWQKATVQRSETLTLQSEQQAAQIQQALARLDQTFKEAKPQEREASLQRLADSQKELGELWRKTNEAALKQALEKGAQSFGRMDAQKLAEWRDQLKKGDVSGLKKELSEMRADLQKLANLPDSAERRAQEEALAQRLNQLADALKQSTGSPELDAALNRAQQQLSLSKGNALSREALQGAMDSLQLSEKELQQLAQAMQDGQALEDALKSLQMAKQLAGKGQLDGAQGQGNQSLEDYAKLFSEKMAQLGGAANGDGAEVNAADTGMGPGIGSGAKRPEDDSVTTGFKIEKSNTALTSGKMLLEWKTKEVGETGARGEEFRDALKEVKQGVSEAIQQEQVPPGYHEAIKKYFDTLPAK